MSGRNRVKLEFIEDYKECKGIGRYKVIRVVARAMFKGKRWTTPIKAILDTGAHISLLPFSIWNNIEIKSCGNDYLRGVVPKEECKLPIDIGRVGCIISDEFGNQMREFEIYAYLAPSDDFPLLLGFKDLLERLKVCFDYKERDAYIEESEPL